MVGFPSGHVRQGLDEFLAVAGGLQFAVRSPGQCLDTSVGSPHNDIFLAA